MQRCELCKDFIDEDHQFKWKECKCKNLRVSGSGYTVKHPNTSVWVNDEGRTCEEEHQYFHKEQREQARADLLTMNRDEFIDKWFVTPEYNEYEY